VRLWLALLLGCSSSSERPSPPDKPPIADAAPLPPDPPPEDVGDLPVECGVYKAVAGKVARCEQLGPQRRVLLEQFDSSWKAWSQLPKADRPGVATACRAAADALKVALVGCEGRS
jgi:hypothetical protein